MKVYRSNDSDTPKRRFGKRGILAIGVSAALAVAAIAVTLTLVLSGGGGNTPVNVDPPVANTPVYVLPLDEFELGREFSNQRIVKFKTMGFWETHQAVDFLTTANAPVKAVSDGKVISIETNTSIDGTVIVIEHAQGVVSIYKGLNSNVQVEEGDTVKGGKVIGTVGVMIMEKNDYSKPHLHLEMKKNNAFVNPLSYLPDIGDK